MERRRDLRSRQTCYWCFVCLVVSVGFAQDRWRDEVRTPFIADDKVIGLSSKHFRHTLTTYNKLGGWNRLRVHIVFHRDLKKQIDDS